MTAIDGVHTLSLSPQKGDSKAIFYLYFIRLKLDFNRTKSATKFLCVKTSSVKVVL